jgi:hypothetical protein
VAGCRDYCDDPFVSGATELVIVFALCIGDNCRSQWPHGLRRSSAAAWLLWSRVRIPLGVWMFACCVCVLCCHV